jgi:sigma-B regulation protein RsbU (phosphoserine phosphatase)
VSGSRTTPLEDELRVLLDDDPHELYERAPCGYLSTAPDGTIVKANETFLRWTGFSRDQLIGRRTFASLLSAGGRIYHDTHYAPMLAMQASVREIALDLVRGDGRRLPVLLNAVLSRDADGRPAVIRIVVFDATERRGYERELLRAKQRAEESEARARSLARTLQATLIPPRLPDIRDLDIAAVYRPAGSGEEVGGDFYDVFQVDEDNWVVVLGDVCGKGVDAAIVTALVRHTLRAVTVRFDGPAEALHALNQVLLAHSTDRFCTVALLRLRRDGQAWSMTLSLGGHPPLLLLRHGHGVQAGIPGSLVGVLDDPAFAEAQLALEAGTTVVLYTDGVTEGRRHDELYGEERLLRAATTSGETAAQVAEGILSDVLAFQQDVPRDDIAVVALRMPPRAGRVR